MNEKYLTVTALTKYIKRKLDMDPHLSSIWLKGEISNFNHHSRGHMYLTIKDKQTRVQAVMFAGNNRRLKFTPENGMNVLIKGDISVFESFGQYQLYIQEMEPDGIGALYLAYEQLKEKLRKQGYFSQEHKKEIPKFPNHICIITSPTGAAVRDIITTLKRRYPIAKSTVIPTLVQGELAASSIAKAIEKANTMGLFDVLILGRGGGSIEDLWPFNEEVVAKAIYKSNIPIISAIGHETDHTISDFVADHRAPTPTGAAEIVVPSQEELRLNLASLKRSLTHSLKTQIIYNQKHLDRLKQSYAFRYPENLISQKEQELDRVTQGFTNTTKRLIQTKTERFTNINMRLKQQHLQEKHERATSELSQLIKRLNSGISKAYETKEQQLIAIIEKVTLLNPLEIMKRGFALPYTINKEIIKSKSQIKVKDDVIIRLTDGEMLCKVLEVKEDHDD